MATKKKALKVRKPRVGKSYELTAKGLKAIEDDSLGPQASLVAKALKVKGAATAAQVAQAIGSKLKTEQPVVRVVSYYFGQFKADNLAKPSKKVVAISDKVA